MNNELEKKDKKLVDLQTRTKQYAFRIIKLTEALPKTNTARVLGNQLLRSGTSVAANYRAACRARSRAEFIAKLGIIIEEADESEFWLEMIVEAALMKKERIQPLLGETKEIISIMVASRKSARKKA